jgi:hypothetical protein
MGRSNIPTMLNSFDTGSDFIITEQRLHFKIQLSFVLIVSSETLPITDNFELELAPCLFTVYNLSKQYCYSKIHSSRCRKKLGTLQAEASVKMINEQ